MNYIDVFGGLLSHLKIQQRYASMIRRQGVHRARRVMGACMYGAKDVRMSSAAYDGVGKLKQVCASGQCQDRPTEFQPPQWEG